MKNISSAGVVVFRAHGETLEYLLLQYVSGHWDFPKGKIEPSETKEQTALRELYEETALQVALIPSFEVSFSYIFKDKDKQKTYKTVYFFLGTCTDDSQKVTISHEHTGYSWLDYDHALYRLTFDNAKEVLQKAHTFILKMIESQK
ncbi:MAG TPA: NUDIX domain-containing protein [Candidatus Bathyarchaeia archaeon]|nr:NUDIX domain-containing protein [Candidatus Bathyarchaeia archaeon]